MTEKIRFFLRPPADNENGGFSFSSDQDHNQIIYISSNELFQDDSKIPVTSLIGPISKLEDGNEIKISNISEFLYDLDGNQINLSIAKKNKVIGIGVNALRKNFNKRKIDASTDNESGVLSFNDFSLTNLFDTSTIREESSINEIEDRKVGYYIPYNNEDNIFGSINFDNVGSTILDLLEVVLYGTVLSVFIDLLETLSNLLSSLFKGFPEDFKSRTDLNLGSSIQSPNSLFSILEIIEKLITDATRIPKTTGSKLSTFLLGIYSYIPGTNVKAVASSSSGELIAASLVQELINVVIGLVTSKDQFRITLRRIVLGIHNYNLKSGQENVLSEFDSFLKLFNSYVMRFYVERVIVGDAIFSYIKGKTSPDVGINVRELPENAHTRLMKSKKGEARELPGNSAASPLRLSALPTRYIIPHGFMAAAATYREGKNGDGLSKFDKISLGSSIGKFLKGTKDGKFDAKNVNSLEEKDSKWQESNGLNIDYDELQNQGLMNNNRLSSDYVKFLEDTMESEYVPFYLQDLRTNEIIAFHAFIQNLSDSYNSSYSPTSGYGRIDDVQIYQKTTRSVQVNFFVVATNPEDFDFMWYTLNKLSSMMYPQWSKGNITKGGFVQPFSQVPTSSPMVRLRLGDLFKSNYSKFNLSRLFGVGTESFTPSKNFFKAADENIIYPDELKEVNEHFDTDKNSSDKIKKMSMNPNDDDFEDTTYGIKKEESNIREVYLLPGVYKLVKLPEDGVLGALGVAAALLPMIGDVVNKYVRINEQLKCVIFSDKLPEDKGISHTHGYTLKPITPTENISSIIEKDMGILASFDSISSIDSSNKSIDNSKVSNLSNSDEKFKTYTEKSNEFLRSFDDAGLNNPITAGFESTRGRGLAGFITNLDFNYNDSTWETSLIGSKAPMFVNVQMTFNPIHDIPPGLDHEGAMRAPIYNTGKIMNSMYGDVYEDNLEKAKEQSLKAQDSLYK